MALAFPYTLDYVGPGTFGNYPHQVFGEYQYGGASYLVAHDTGGTGLTAVYKKSGGSWALQDGSNAPRNSYWSGAKIINATELGVTRSGSKLWVLFGTYAPGFPVPATVEMCVWAFDMASDTWAAAPIQGGPAMNKTAGGYRPKACPVFRSTGEMVVLYNSGTRPPDRCSVVRLDTGSGTWSAPDAAPVPDAAKWYIAASAVVDSEDNVQCLFSETTFMAGTYVYHAEYAADNTFGSASIACDQTFYSTSDTPRPLSNLISFTSGGTAKLAFLLLSENTPGGNPYTVFDLYYVEGTTGTPWTWTQTLIKADCGADNFPVYSGHPCSLCIVSGVKYAFWVELDPPSEPALLPSTDYTAWISYSQNSGSGWSAVADATQRITRTSGVATAPSIQVVHSYWLDGAFTLIFSLNTSGTPYDELYSISVLPAGGADFAFWGSGHGGRTGTNDYGFFV